MFFTIPREKRFTITTGRSKTKKSYRPFRSIDYAHKKKKTEILTKCTSDKNTQHRKKTTATKKKSNKNNFDSAFPISKSQI